MTEIGIVGDAPVFDLGPAGSIGRIGHGVAFDWWVGAEDRWHVAGDEVAVRQSLATDGTTIETRIKIPGGDAVQRMTAIPWAGGAVALVEIQNETPVPFALGIALEFEPGDVKVYDDTVSVDGRSVLRAGRSVARVAIGDSIADARAVVEAGGAVPPAELTGPTAGGAVVAIFPVPHTATVQVVWSSDGVTSLAAPADLPPLDAVSRGWEAHLGHGASVALPDERLVRSAIAARRHLLSGSARPLAAAFWTVGVEPWVPAVAAAALDAWGHHSEARSLLLTASGFDDPGEHAARKAPATAALLWAWAERLDRVPDPDLEGVLGSWTEQLIAALLVRPRRFGRRRTPASPGWRAVGLASGASLVARFGDRALAADIIDALEVLTDEVDDTDPADQLPLALAGRRLDMVFPRGKNLVDVMVERSGLEASDNPMAALVAPASGLGAVASATRSQDPTWSALMLLTLKRTMVDEPLGAGGPVALLAHPDRQWLGGHLEAHDMPIGSGVSETATVSFGVRWHGDRPAVLWDRTESSGDSAVTTPFLDPEWRNVEPKGEALLAPTDGLGEVTAMDSPTVRSGEVVDLGDEPQSFG